MVKLVKMLQIKYFIIFEDKKYFIAAAVSNNWTVNKKKKRKWENDYNISNERTVFYGLTESFILYFCFLLLSEIKKIK